MAFAAHASDPDRAMKQIGILRTDTAFDAWFEAFRSTLDELGYREGKEVTYEYRLAPAADMQQTAAEMIRTGADLLIAAGTPAALAAKRTSFTARLCS